jgi:imidazolonepropionase-like amidohydrolase
MDCLEAGFTTLRNIENPGESVGVSLKRAIQMSVITGPRLITSGTIAATGSSIDFDKPVSWPRISGELADGEDEARRQVRERLRRGADFIKIFASGGIMETRKLIRRNYTPREVAAIVEEAHAHGLRVAAHAEGPEGIQMVLDAGIDSVEHGFYLSDENIQSMAAKGIYLVPTLSYLVRLAQGDILGVEPVVVEKAESIAKSLSEYFPKCIKAGVKIAMGTDTWRELSAVKFGGNSYELEQMVRFGMTTSQALISTTKTAAELLGLQDEIGTLHAGKLADIVIVKGNPLEDITVLQNEERITHVIKEGRIVTQRTN